MSNITTNINIDDPVGGHQRSQRLIRLATNNPGPLFSTVDIPLSHSPGAGVVPMTDYHRKVLADNYIFLLDNIIADHLGPHLVQNGASHF